MIEALEFKNYRVLKEARLPLGRFTLIVGPNGSGKSTALRAFEMVAHQGAFPSAGMLSADVRDDARAETEIIIHCGPPHSGVVARAIWSQGHTPTLVFRDASDHELKAAQYSGWPLIKNARIYWFDAVAIAQPVRLQPNMELDCSGRNLAGVLDSIRDKHPERFEALNSELTRCMPEFDRILFDTPGEGTRSILLRTREGQRSIASADLSHGTLLALAILTLAHLPAPPPIICLEEPDSGIHPRLLREVRDALYRLCFPESFGEKRNPVQVIATTHSPYFLDLYREHPEEVVIAEKRGPYAYFERLADRPDINEILQDAHLGEVWYSGILGGVPSLP